MRHDRVYTAGELDRVAAAQWRRQYARIVVPVTALITAGLFVAAILTAYVEYVMG